MQILHVRYTVCQIHRPPGIHVATACHTATQLTVCDSGWCFSIYTHLHTFPSPTYIGIYVYTYLGDARSKVHEDQASHSPPTCRMARQCHHMSGVVACSPCRGNKDMLQQEPSIPRRRLNLLRCYAGDQINVAAPGKRLVDHHTKKHLCRYRPV